MIKNLTGPGKINIDIDFQADPIKVGRELSEDVKTARRQHGLTEGNESMYFYLLWDYLEVSLQHMRKGEIKQAKTMYRSVKGILNFLQRTNQE
jgi:hypothetical protein